MKLFIDSNFFCALYNPSDSQHQKAVKIAGILKKENPSLFISNFIFLETVTIISQRVGKQTAVQIGNHLMDESKVTMINVNSQLNQQTWEFFQQIKNKNISFVDISIPVVLSAEGIRNFLTFDTDHFKILQKHFPFKFFPRL